MPRENILIVEDEELMRSILRQLLEAAGYAVFTADSAETAVEIFTENEIGVTLTDIKMAGRSGIELLDQIKSLDGDALVIVMTAYSSVDTAIAALRKGAYDYITKPFVNDDLLQTIRNAVVHRVHFRENRVLRREAGRHSGFADIIGKSDALRRVFDVIQKVADTSANVLITGESGTGKELVARAIHSNSSRRELPFLAVNCGALPESLLESEMFGHVRGAFTGAVSDTPGLFRSVSGGTLFLDEIGEMPPSLQVKLLRALQEHEVTPVGASRPVSFDARLVAATNKVLDTEISEGRFREDLYYRLNVVEIAVPPLRDRPDDIPVLINHFGARFARQQQIPLARVTPEAMSRMSAYNWPGNIRELENVIERAVILSEDGLIGADCLPPRLWSNVSDSAGEVTTLDEIEKAHISETLRRVGNDKVKAAEILGIDLSTLYRKLKRL